MDSEASPDLDLISDATFKDITPKKLPRLMPSGYGPSFAILADQETFSHPEHPILFVDLLEKPGRSFRAALKALVEVHSNLSLANMEFSDFAGAVDKDKIFREFQE